MTSKVTHPLKINPIGKEFIENLQRNFNFTNKTKISLGDCVDVVAKYFKNNNDKYLEMIGEKNVR